MVTLPRTSGGNAPLTYSLMPALPARLTFNAKTRAITGAPTTALAATRFIYRVRDTDGDTRQLTFNITVNEATGDGGGSQQPTQPVGGSNDEDDGDHRPSAIRPVPPTGQAKATRARCGGATTAASSSRTSSPTLTMTGGGPFAAPIATVIRRFGPTRPTAEDTVASMDFSMGNLCSRVVRSPCEVQDRAP